MYLFLFISVTYNAFIIGNHRISMLLIHEFRDESNPSHLTYTWFPLRPIIFSTRERDGRIRDRM